MTTAQPPHCGPSSQCEPKLSCSVELQTFNQVRGHVWSATMVPCLTPTILSETRQREKEGAARPSRDRGSGRPQGSKPGWDQPSEQNFFKKTIWPHRAPRTIQGTQEHINKSQTSPKRRSTRTAVKPPELLRETRTRSKRTPQPPNRRIKRLPFVSAIRKSSGPEHCVPSISP